MAERTWALADALAWMVERFEREGVEAPRRSAEWLLSAATGLSRVEVYAYSDRPLGADERAALREGVQRRLAGEPLQYVTGEMPFRHLVVRVRPGVFIPRPETEVLVDAALAGIAEVASPLVVEVCTGSGCVACAVATERPTARVFATDLSPHAVEVARENVTRLGIADRVAVTEGDLFAAVPGELRGTVDLVVANPPYVPSAALADLPAEVQGFEPRLALDGGADGLDVVRRIAAEAAEWLAPGGVLAVEIDETCEISAPKVVDEWYQEVTLIRDLAGRARVVVGRRT